MKLHFDATIRIFTPEPMILWVKGSGNVADYVKGNKFSEKRMAERYIRKTVIDAVNSNKAEYWDVVISFEENNEPNPNKGQRRR